VVLMGSSDCAFASREIPVSTIVTSKGSASVWNTARAIEDPPRIGRVEQVRELWATKRQTWGSIGDFNSLALTSTSTSTFS